jgi:hypothetical protein
MLERLTKWFFELRRGNTKYKEIVAEPITTTDATPTTWTAVEIAPDTTTAGSMTVRYIFNAMQSDGSNLYSITSECSWSWAAGGAITRRSASGGAGTSNANTFAPTRPLHSFDLNNIRPTVTGKLATTIVWSCQYRIVQYQT